MDLRSFCLPNSGANSWKFLVSPPAEYLTIVGWVGFSRHGKLEELKFDRRPGARSVLWQVSKNVAFRAYMKNLAGEGVANCSPEELTLLTGRQNVQVRFLFGGGAIS